jgi:hypothetical protein
MQGRFLLGAGQVIVGCGRVNHKSEGGRESGFCAPGEVNMQWLPDKI